jgi:PLP dependent protein
MPAARAKIEDNLRRIREDIAGACARKGRSQREVSIVAVTKSVDVETIRVLPELGLTDLGESRVQQLVDRVGELAGFFQGRAAAFPAPVRWHMIGHLQRNKVRPLLGAADAIHSVDSLRLAEDISARAEAAGTTVDLLIEVNCSQEPQKYGLAVGAVPHMAALIATMKNVRMLGLMTMAPRVRDMEGARPTFARLREIFDEMRRDNIGGPDFRHLSMGMSQDYPVAVEEGATMLRIGTALFE